MNDQYDQSGHGEFEPVEEMQVEEPRRAASVTLRSDESAQLRSASMEAANRSLADALRIVYRLLQGLMVALLLLFAFSGFQKIDQGELGVKVTFGRLSPRILEPGPVFSLPYPMGEVIKVSRGDQTISILQSFWPEGLDPDRPNASGSPSLKPGQDGSLLTGDNNIVHAQLDVSYHREDPLNYLENLQPDSEEALIRSAVERAMVQAAAQVSIDELLARGFGSAVVAPETQAEADSPADGEGATGDESSLESRVRSTAQRLLDESLDIGVEIDRVTIREIRPPQRTLEDFRQKNAAVTNAARAREEAERERDTMLTSAAGTAYRPLLDLIDEYEGLLEIGNEEEAEEVFAAINRLLDGAYEPNDAGAIEIRGRTYQNVRVSGEVSELISSAKQYRSTVVSNAERQSADFDAKLEQFRANPKQFLAQEWYRGFQTLLEDPVVESFLIPEGSEPLRLKINPDPAFLREIEQEIKRRQVEGDERLERAYRAGRPGG